MHDKRVKDRQNNSYKNNKDIGAGEVETSLAHARHHQDARTINSAIFELTDDFRPSQLASLSMYPEAFEAVDIEHLISKQTLGLFK